MLSITAWPTKQPLKQHAGNTLQHWHAPGTQQQQKPLKNEQPVTVLPGEGSGGSSESAWGHETGGGSRGGSRRRGSGRTLSAPG